MNKRHISARKSPVNKILNNHHFLWIEITAKYIIVSRVSERITVFSPLNLEFDKIVMILSTSKRTQCIISIIKRHRQEHEIKEAVRPDRQSWTLDLGVFSYIPENDQAESEAVVVICVWWRSFFSRPHNIRCGYFFKRNELSYKEAEFAAGFYVHIQRNISCWQYEQDNHSTQHKQEETTAKQLLNYSWKKIIFSISVTHFKQLEQWTLWCLFFLFDNSFPTT